MLLLLRKRCEQNSKKIFAKYAKNKYEILNIDFFQYKITKKKFDIVVSMGAAHHTKNVKKNLS